MAPLFALCVQLFCREIPCRYRRRYIHMYNVALIVAPECGLTNSSNKKKIVIFRRKIRRKIRDSATRGRKVPCSYSTHTILLTILHIIRVDKIFRPSCGLEVFFLFFFDPCRAAAIPAMVFDECTPQSALEKPVPGTRGVHCLVRDS